MKVAKKIIVDQLSALYPKQELEGFSRLIFEKVTGYSPIEVHLNQNETISAANLTQIKEIVNRLAQFEPIQYILGETEFYGSKIKVNPSVLIPRQETEELVDWIIKDFRNTTPSILDMGTGSGCILVALMKNLPGASAKGWDISTEALDVAKQNARINNVSIDFQCVDILRTTIPNQNLKYDIIVSNPPYIRLSEKILMHKNVTQFEPHLALFVPDHDSLVFYDKIAGFALNQLVSGGCLFFEINENSGPETTKLLASKGLINLVLKKDINGKDRMIRCQRP